MSTCSSRINERRRSSGPENSASSTTKLGWVSNVSGVYVAVIGAPRSRQPLPEGRERVRLRPAQQISAERQRRLHPGVEQRRHGEQNEQDDDSEPADLLISVRPARGQQVL